MAPLGVATSIANRPMQWSQGLLSSEEGAANLLDLEVQ